MEIVPTRNPPPHQPSEAELDDRKQLVIEIIKEVITSGSLISKVTNEPLTEEEQMDYLIRATFYFISEERDWYHSGANAGRLSPTYDSILRLINLRLPPGVMKGTIKTICETPRKKEEEEKYEKWMEEMIRQRMPHGCQPPPEGQHATNLNELSLIKKFLGHVKENIIGYVTGGAGGTASSFGRSVVSTALDEAALSLQGTFQTYNISTAVRSGVIAAGLYIGGVVSWNAYQVWRGKRSWERAGKNILVESAAVSVGTITGVVIGAFLAPLTGGFSLLFGAIGGIVTSMFTRSCVKKQSYKLFDIPEDEMLEKAYWTLGAGQRDTNDKVGKAYREKSRKYHPDKFLAKKRDATEDEKTANLREFLKVQAALAMIMAAREEDEVEYGNARKNFEMIEDEEELAKKGISIILKLKILSVWNKIPYLRTRAFVNVNVPAIMSGIMPFRFFEETGTGSSKKVSDKKDD